VKLVEIAELVKGEIIGAPDIEITGAAGIHDAKSGDITYLARQGLIGDLLAANASAVLVDEKSDKITIPQVVVNNPQYAFAVLLKHFYCKPHPHNGISLKAIISDSASIGKETTVYPSAYISGNAVIGMRTVIYPGVYIGESCRIGDDCTIYPNVVLRDGVNVGDRVIIHPGAVLGADGFGFIFKDGGHYKIPQVGGVVIEDDVEIGANTTIDRATTGNTVIGKGTKIDNLVQIGHNVKVGRNAIIVAQVGIGGSSIIGDGVILAGQAGIADHAEIEAGTTIGAQAGVASGKLAKGIYVGTPAKPFRVALKAYDLLFKLPELYKNFAEKR
jgi:UDP-3-O-[3-hydroxymyristoyl] glucosamine N-acyltransferase